MYKIISKVMGSVKVSGKDLGYNSFLMVDKITDEITSLQMEGIIKVKVINPTIVSPTSNTTATTSTNKKNKTSGGN